MRISHPVLALVLLTAPAAGQFNNPGAYTSPAHAATTEGPNLLFFGNSYTISSVNPAVHSPSYGGARGIPELVRQIAIAAGHDAPFVKNVYALGRGYDWHVDPTKASLAQIDEPLLGEETWDFVVLQGYSTRPTKHPYLGNGAKHRANGLKLFDEVRAGGTNHSTVSPNVVPVLYQTWAREPGHWLYDTHSSWQIGIYIPIGVQNWLLGPVFPGGPEQMARQVRNGYEQARQYIDASVPSAATRIAPAGDVWRAAGWPSVFFGSDHFHASSWGDLATALTIYATVWGDPDTSGLVASGTLAPTLAAIGVPLPDAQQIAALVDLIVASPPTADEPSAPPTNLLFDFSNTAGAVTTPELLPWPGRHYNLVADHLAGNVTDAVDTRGRATAVDLLITDAFADPTGGGATGAWNGAVQLSGSLYDERAQLDAFFVGNGSGYTDDTARLELRDLDPNGLYRIRIHGSRGNLAHQRVGYYSIGGATRELDAAYNLNLRATFEHVRPDAAGTVAIDVTNGGLSSNFAYVGVLELTTLPFRFDRAPPHTGLPPAKRP